VVALHEQDATARNDYRIRSLQPVQ